MEYYRTSTVLELHLSGYRVNQALCPDLNRFGLSLHLLWSPSLLLVADQPRRMNETYGVNRSPFLTGSMTQDKTRFFQLVDDYARTRHRCFLTELDLWTEERGYSLCFRPLGASDAYKYLMVSTEDVKAAVSRLQLPTSLVDQLDAELPKLKQQL